MNKQSSAVLTELIERYPILSQQQQSIQAAFNLIKTAFTNDKKLLLCGNGGSAADCEHIAGELLKRFKKPRPANKEIVDRLKGYGTDGEYTAHSLEGALPAIALTSHVSFYTAFGNDNSADMAFAQQLYALGRQGDVLLALSTSGNSPSCIYALLTAKASGIKTVGLTGESGGKMAQLCDVCICVPQRETYRVQELHLPVYHCLCAMLEEEFF